MRKIINFLCERVIFKRQMEVFYLTFGGHIFFQTLRTAVQIGLFDLIHTSGPMNRAQIASSLGLNEQPVRIILLGLTSVGFLKKRGDKYALKYIAKLLLLKTSPLNVLAYIELQHRVMYKGVYWLLESVQQNRNVGLKEFKGDEPTLYQRLSHDPQTELIFQKAMENLSVQVNIQLRDNLNLSQVQYLVDVGGGNGTNAMALAKKWPHLKSSVFDSPSVCEIAITNIKNNRMSERVTAISGDCFTDPFPSNADAFLFCHFFTIWSKAQNQSLLAKCYSSLPVGGRVIIFNMMQKDDETGPLSAAVGSPYFLSIATGFGMLYTAQEYKEWMLEAGFGKVLTYRLRRDHGVIVGVK